MVSIRKSIDIKAPIKEVFDWVQWAPNFIGIWPDMVKTVSYEEDENGLGLLVALYSMIGIEFKIVVQNIEKIPNKKIVVESKHPLISTLAWGFDVTNEGTKLSFYGDYKIPAKVLRGLTKSIITRIAEKNIEILLNNVKQEMERLYGEES